MQFRIYAIVLFCFVILSYGCTKPWDVVPPDADEETTQPDADAEEEPDVDLYDADESDIEEEEESPCGELTECGDDCFDLLNDPEHCGDCDYECPLVENGTVSCVEGECVNDCNPGYVMIGEECLLAPRLVWPPSTSVVSIFRPTMRWIPPEDLTEEVTVDICADNACVDVIETHEVKKGRELVPTENLAKGVVFWRVTAGERMSYTWQFTVRNKQINNTDTAWGLIPDYNNDGKGDVAVGAPELDESEGRAYVHIATRDGIDASPTTTIRNPLATEEEEFGYAVACAGDVNGDGFSDLLVGAPGTSDGSGVAYLYFGGTEGMETTPAFTFTNEGLTTRFGATVAGLGDVNGDGYGDFAIAAPGSGSGRVSIFHGSAQGPESTPARDLAGVGYFGSGLAGAGDINGDGFADLVIGAFGVSSNTGEITVYFGSTEGIPATPVQTLQGPDGEGARYGQSVAGAGDLNRDGYCDVVVGAPYFEGSTGHVFAYYGSETGLVLDEFSPSIFTGEGSGFFGHSVIGVGDSNADGFDDIVVGAPFHNGEVGRVYVFFGKRHGLDQSGAPFFDNPYGGEGHFGWSLGAIGSVNGDEIFDFVVGAPKVDLRDGQVFVYRGGETTLPEADFARLSGLDGAGLGFSVAHAGQ